MIILRGKCLFFDEFASKVFVLCKVCEESFCFMIFLRRECLFNDNFATKVFVS